MREGWKYVKLEDVCKFSSGFAFKSNKFTEEGEPIIRISDIQNDKVDDTGVVFFDPKDYDQDLSKYIIYPNDILIAMSGGTTGKIGINKTGKKFYLNQRVGVFREDKAVLDHTFLFHYLHTKSEEGLRIAAGAAQPNLSSAQIKNYIIPLPPLSEQQSIVAHLDASFAEIDALKAKAAEEVANAKAMFDATLREEMTPKEDFLSDKLVNVFNFIDYRGATPTKLSSGIPLVTAKNVKKGYIDYTIKDYISETEYSQRQSRGISHKGDILFTTEAPLGNVALADLEVFSAGQRLITFQQYDSPKYVVENKYYMYYFLSYGFQTTLNKLATGATAQGIKAKILKEVIIPVPPISTQQRIVAKLDTLRSHLTELEQKYNHIAANCDALKQAILRETFE